MPISVLITFLRLYNVVYPVNLTNLKRANFLRFIEVSFDIFLFEIFGPTYMRGMQETENEITHEIGENVLCCVSFIVCSKHLMAVRLLTIRI